MAVSISYDDIFSEFLLSVDDWDITSLSDDVVNSFMLGFFNSAISEPYIRKIFSSFELDDENSSIVFELRSPVSDSDDARYVTKVIAQGMVIKWLDPQITSTRYTQQVFSNSEAKYYSQKEQLMGLIELQQKKERDLRKYIRDHGYVYNSYLEDDGGA